MQKVSETLPLSQLEHDSIVNTAIAGEQLGHQLIYLEAGSGAIIVVDGNIIHKVTDQVSIPIIVGGGIRDAENANAAWQSGATVVVIGTAFEKGELNLDEMLLLRDQWNR